MAFPKVIVRGEKFLNSYPRNTTIWYWLSYGTCLATIALTKLVLKTCYSTTLNGYQNIEEALQRSDSEKRGIITVMNHMSMVDDPFLWGVFPLRMYSKLSRIRWGLGADNICFANKPMSWFFSLGKVLSTVRFGRGIFQGSIDASIKLLSDKNQPSWVHVFPEGFILQLHSPHANSMRYFKWGVARMILESDVTPIVVPMFSTGFENITPEDKKMARGKIIPGGYGNAINVSMGKAIDDDVIENYRARWRELCKKYADPNCPDDLNDNLKYGNEAEKLRSELANDIREHVLEIRHTIRKLPAEDQRFKSPLWWKKFNQTNGLVAPDIHVVGQNFAKLSNQKNVDVPKVKDN